jgi:hypothetical protein
MKRLVTLHRVIIEQFIAEHGIEYDLQFVTPFFLNSLECLYTKKACKFLQSYEKKFTFLLMRRDKIRYLSNKLAFIISLSNTLLAACDWPRGFMVWRSQTGVSGLLYFSSSIAYRSSQGLAKLYPRCSHTQASCLSMTRVWQQYAS